jgi:hypothetical protein
VLLLYSQADKGRIVPGIGEPPEQPPPGFTAWVVGWPLAGWYVADVALPVPWT